VRSQWHRPFLPAASSPACQFIIVQPAPARAKIATISALPDRVSSRENSPIVMSPILRSDMPDRRDKVRICCTLSLEATLSAMHAAVSRGRPILMRLERMRLSGVEQALNAMRLNPATKAEARISNLLIKPELTLFSDQTEPAIDEIGEGREMRRNEQVIPQSAPNYDFVPPLMPRDGDGPATPCPLATHHPPLEQCPLLPLCHPIADSPLATP